MLMLPTNGQFCGKDGLRQQLARVVSLAGPRRDFARGSRPLPPDASSAFGLLAHRQSDGAKVCFWLDVGDRGGSLKDVSREPGVRHLALHLLPPIVIARCWAAIRATATIDETLDGFVNGDAGLLAASAASEARVPLHPAVAAEVAGVRSSFYATTAAAAAVQVAVAPPGLR